MLEIGVKSEDGTGGEGAGYKTSAECLYEISEFFSQQFWHSGVLHVH